MVRAFVASVLLAAAACDGYPRDPRGTLERAQGGELRVGVVAAPSAGRERELAAAFAADIHARIAWRDGSEHDLLKSLEHGEVDLVVGGGLSPDSPWREHVAFTRPYDDHRVLAVAPGENAFLLRLDRFISGRKRAE